MKKVGVTAAEMLCLREQGLSNHDIAKSLDISYATVRKYIGKQEGRMERLAAFADTRVDKSNKHDEHSVAHYEAKPVMESFIVGDCFRVELDHEARLISINKELVFEYDQLPGLVQFLAWAMRARMQPDDKENSNV